MTAPLPPPAPTESPPSRRFPLKKLLLLALILTVVFIPWAVREYRLSQIPLISDPFDVQAYFESSRISDSENAFVDYRAAVAAFQNKPEWWTALTKIRNPTILPQDKVPAVAQEAVAVNERSLNLWEKGTLKPKAVNILPENLQIHTTLDVSHKLSSLKDIASWKQILLQDAEQLEDSWKIIVGGYRTSVHLMQSGTMIERLIGIKFHSAFERNLSRWAEDLQIAPSQLRSALSEFQSIRKKVPPMSHNLKTEYLIYRRPTAEVRRAMILKPMIAPDSTLTNRMNAWIEGPGTDMYFGLLGEYEYIERLTPHLYANRLAHIDDTRRIREQSVLLGGGVPFFKDEKPSGSHIASPELQRLANGSSQLKHFASGFESLLNANDRDQARWTADEIILALQLYHREHGKFPPDLNALVPNFLSSLPENPFALEVGGPLLYKVESDHVVLWTQGKYQSVPLEEGPTYFLNRGGPTVDAMFWTIYPPGTRPPLYRPYPAGYEEALEKKRQAEIEKKKRDPGMIIGG